MYLKEFREKIGLSQKEFSEKIGIDKTNIGRYERDEVKPTSIAIEKYINVFNASPNYLFLGIEPYVTDIISAESQKIKDEIKYLVTDIIVLEGTKNLESKLQKIKFDIIKKKFEKDNNNIIIKFLNLTGPSRPVLFLYYILQSIEQNKNDKIIEYSNFLIQIIKDFPKWNLFINQPMFGKQIINDFVETIEYKLSDEESKYLVEESSNLINLLEEEMPLYVLKANKNKFK